MRIRLLIGFLILGGGLSYWAFTAFRKENNIVAVTNSENETQQREIAAVQSVSSAGVDKPQSLVTNNSVTIVKPIQVGILPQPEVIQKFKVIQAKVFKTDEDQRHLKAMISDSVYLLQLGGYLRDLQSVHKSEFKENQNAVIDLLLEALKNGDAQSAQQAILDVIQDSQVEDEKLALNTRELLGGVKAELLYQSSSIKPELSQQIERVLPGPISQKIWKNVQEQQADNLALSETELQARSAPSNQ